MSVALRRRAVDWGPPLLVFALVFLLLLSVYRRAVLNNLDKTRVPSPSCQSQALVISLGSVGLPGQVSLIATNMPVVQAMGLPVAPLGLMLAVETIPDAFATLGNVTGDLTATAIAARQNDE